MRRSEDGKSIRVGKVLSREKGVFSVRWNDDGTEENLRLDSRNQLAIEGTLRFMSLMDPDEVIKKFTDDPLGVVLQLLIEHPKGLKAQDVKSKLLEFGLDEASVDKAWKRIQPKLAKHDSVELASNVYHARPSETPSSVALPDADKAEEIPTPETSQAVASKEPAGSFSERLAKLLDAKQSRDIQEYLAEPLHTGVALGRLDVPAISTFFGELDETDRRIFSTLLLAVPKKTPVESLSPEIWQGVLIAAIAELRSQTSSELLTAARWLLRRVAARPEMSSELVRPFIQLALFLAKDPQKADLEVLDLVAHALSRAIPHLGKDVVSPERVALLAQPLPFSDKGGRVPLMVAVHQRWPGSLLSPRWWDGATTASLVECGQGRFGRIIASPEILESVVRPLLERELAEVTTRARLGLFLSLPAELAEQLPIPAVANAFRRVSRHDPIAAGWAEALSGHEQLVAARNELQRAREEAETATALMTEAERRAQELSERCTRLERELHETQTSVLRRRASQDRQLQIDVMRALADLAAEVEELSARSVSSETMISRIHGLTSAYKMTPIGTIHEKSVFDPRRHKAIAGDPEPGEEVIIRRPGYVWSSSTEEVVLHKALVEHQK